MHYATCWKSSDVLLGSLGASAAIRIGQPGPPCRRPRSDVVERGLWAQLLPASAWRSAQSPGVDWRNLRMKLMKQIVDQNIDVMTFDVIYTFVDLCVHMNMYVIENYVVMKCDEQGF